MGIIKQLQIEVMDIEQIIREAKEDLGDDLGGLSEVDLIADKRTDLPLDEIRTLLKISKEGFQ